MAKENYGKKVHQYQFKVNQQILLDVHYFLNKNQKEAPKYSGPHLITKIKGQYNVELLLQNGKTCIVHANCIKPYDSFENSGQHFSKQGRDNDGIQKSLADRSEDENSDLEQETTWPTPQETQNSQERGEDTRLTRKQAQLQGMVYNKNTLQFQKHSPSETIETLRKKYKYIHQKIQENEDHILIEDVYYQVVPHRFIKQESKDSLPDLPSDSDFEDVPEIKVQTRRKDNTQNNKTQTSSNTFISQRRTRPTYR